MKISNNGLLGAAWFILSVTYTATVITHLVREAFVSGEFAVPICLDNHLLEDLPIPVAGAVASLFLGKHAVWPRVVLGLAAGGLIFVILGILSSTRHHKPYVFILPALIGCVWTIMSVTKRSHSPAPPSCGMPPRNQEPNRRGMQPTTSLLDEFEFPTAGASTQRSLKKYAYLPILPETERAHSHLRRSPSAYRI